MQPTYCSGGFPHHSCSKSLCESTWTIQNCLQIISRNQSFSPEYPAYMYFWTRQMWNFPDSLHPKFHLLSSELYLTCRNPKLILLSVWRCFLPKHRPLDLTNFYKKIKIKIKSRNIQTVLFPVSYISFIRIFFTEGSKTHKGVATAAVSS